MQPWFAFQQKVVLDSYGPFSVFTKNSNSLLSSVEMSPTILAWRELIIWFLRMGQERDGFVQVTHYDDSIKTGQHPMQVRRVPLHQS
jgi:hypothetical protein